jgi:hypothetical protein
MGTFSRLKRVPGWYAPKPSLVQPRLLTAEDVGQPPPARRPLTVSVGAGARWQADSLQTRADALLSRSDTIDGLIQLTQRELSNKHKDFEHYKTRAQTEMAISLQASVGFVELESPFASPSPPSRSTEVDRTALHACRKRAMRLICEFRVITVAELTVALH